MATYAELLQAAGSDPLRQKVRVACFVAAEKIRVEDPGIANHAARIAWAKAVFNNPEAEGNRMLWTVLAQNAAVPYASILSASDAAVQGFVDASVNVFI